ncbi:Uncharacterized protein LOK49_LG13G02284 [Camellia lanceoleosa]|uniref:Uncharacterized protein n=1 Tax=Camellia lanceoleosa TaxID=1840588 RepID=A0ACC0FNE1_9ERIC|nr:Uncharacterized protein LOK49_LG13G02284 [Camellia lanceoleosa]
MLLNKQSCPFISQVNLQPKVPTKAVRAEYLELRKEILTLLNLQAEKQPIDKAANKLLCFCSVGSECSELRTVVFSKVALRTIRSVSRKAWSELWAVDLCCFSSCLCVDLPRKESNTSDQHTEWVQHLTGTMVPGIKTGRRKRPTSGNVLSASEACPQEIGTPLTFSDETQPPDDTQTVVEETQPGGIEKHGIIIEFTDPDYNTRRSATYLPEVAAHEGQFVT